MLQEEFGTDYEIIRETINRSDGNILNKLIGKDFIYELKVIDEEKTESYYSLKELELKRESLKKYKSGEDMSEEEVKRALSYQKEKENKKHFKNLKDLDEKDTENIIKNTVENRLKVLRSEIKREIKKENEKQYRKDLEGRVKEELEKTKKKKNKVWEEIEHYLLDYGVGFDNVIKIKNKVCHIPNKEEMIRRINTIIENKLKNRNNNNLNKEHRTMYFGSTGIGKTSTLIKLAHKEGKKESLIISTDTVRLGAKVEIEEYKKRYKVNTEFRDLSKDKLSVKELEKFKYVHLDFPGANPKNIKNIIELKNIGESLGFNKKTLMVDSTQNNKDILKNIESYKQVGVDSIIVTKVDQTSHPGVVIDIIFNTEIPIDYYTNGQNVTAFIRSFETKEFLEYFWKDVYKEKCSENQNIKREVQ